MFHDKISYAVIKAMSETTKSWLPKDLTGLDYVNVAYYTPSNANWSYRVVMAKVKDDEGNEQDMYLLTQFGQVKGCRSVYPKVTDEKVYTVVKDGKSWGGRKFTGRGKRMDLFEAAWVAAKHGGIIDEITLDNDGWGVRVRVYKEEN